MLGQLNLACFFSKVYNFQIRAAFLRIVMKKDQDCDITTIKYTRLGKALPNNPKNN